MYRLMMVVKFAGLIVDNVRRNIVRSVLTSLGTMVLVLVVTLVYTVLTNLDAATSEKASNLKVIITERWQLPSQMPWAYANTLVEGAAEEAGDARPTDYMTWGFFVGSVESDPKLRTFESSIFAFVTEADKVMTMMDELENLPPELDAELAKVIQKMQDNPQGIVVGQDRLEKLNKRVGERMTIYGRNYKDLDLEVEIVGAFPKGYYDALAVIQRRYFNQALDQYQRTKGQPHPLADKTLNLVWLRVPNQQAFEKVSEQISSSPLYTVPPVKCETAAAGITTFLEGYRDLLWGVRWLLAPACMVTLSLIIANAISISVRERQQEFAVLKVLGFRPFQILLLVLGEAVLIGASSGVLSAAVTYFGINFGLGGLYFPVGFFPRFWVPVDAFWWGLAVGGGTAIIGSFLPAWAARTVKVSEVFSRVA